MNPENRIDPEQKSYRQLLMFGKNGCEEENMTTTAISRMENRKKASETIREKIRQAGGSVIVTFLQGNKHHITIKDGKIFCTDARFPLLSFELFDEIVEFLCKSGGKAKKGNGRSRIGSDKCKKGTVSYCIATSPSGMAKEPGESAKDPISLVAAILDWAGIARNIKRYLELV